MLHAARRSAGEADACGGLARRLGLADKTDTMDPHTVDTSQILHLFAALVAREGGSLCVLETELARVPPFATLAIAPSSTHVLVHLRDEHGHPYRSAIGDPKP